LKFTVLDIKKACTRMLRTAFPSIPVYDNDTVDGYQRPCFFVEVLSYGRHRESADLQKAAYSYVITYFELTHDEADCLRKYEAICDAFGHAVRVVDGSRDRIVVKDVELSWIGNTINDNKDMMQISISFYESIVITEPADENELMQTVTTEFI